MSLFDTDFEKNRREGIAQAKLCPKGLDVEQLVPGAIVTFGPSKATGDRSYTDVIWEVVAINGCQVAAKAVYGTFYGSPVHLFVFSEHEWYPGEGLLDAIKTAEKVIKF